MPCHHLCFLALLIPFAVVTLVIEFYTLQRRLAVMNKYNVKTALEKTERHLMVDDAVMNQ